MRVDGTPALDYNPIALDWGRTEPERRPVKEKEKRATLISLNLVLRELRVSYLPLRKKEV